MSEKKPLDISEVICYPLEYMDLFTTIFPVSGATTWVFLLPLVSFVVSAFTPPRDSGSFSGSSSRSKSEH